MESRPQYGRYQGISTVFDRTCGPTCGALRIAEGHNRSVQVVWSLHVSEPLTCKLSILIIHAWETSGTILCAIWRKLWHHSNAYPLLNSDRFGGGSEMMRDGDSSDVWDQLENATE